MQKQLIIEEVKYQQIQPNIKMYVNIIFTHFISLTEYSYIDHSQQSIYKLLSSENMFGYIVRHPTTKNIIGYMFGETSLLPDGRNAYYLSYIYVVPKYQHMKIGTILMTKIIQHCKYVGVPFIVLTCDIEDKKLMNFYKKFGFVFDLLLKKNKKHDVLCLYL